jgi:hypothetical protein
MKTLVLTAALAIICTSLVPGARAQVFGTDDRAAARAERNRQGAAAARGAQIGEGNPIPDTRAPTSPEDRAAARAERASSGAAAARGPQIGEGDPIPQATPRAPAADRSTARKARTGEAARANKAGEIKSKGETGP